MNAQAESKKNIVIVGATGMVGGYALDHALNHPAVSSVTVVGRRKLSISHPKLKDILHQDFSDCSALKEFLLRQDAAIFCLGTYTGAVPEVELRKITVDYALEFARALHSGSPGAIFSFLSGNGADQTGLSRMAFARYKGEAERELLAINFRRTLLFRPAYIYPVKPRLEPNLSYRILRVIYPAFRVLFPNLVIRADHLAWLMVDAAVEELEGPADQILENRDIRALAQPRYLKSTNGHDR